MSDTEPTGAQPARVADPGIIVVMGVSGCGKSTVARQLAADLQAHFKDGDELHPAGNIEKMAAGVPLSDADRQPWLAEVAHYARIHAREYGLCVIACSALKQRYRQILNTAGSVVYVYLHGSRDLIASRMHQRKGHFMPEALLESQFAALEDPRSEDNVVTVDIDDDIPTISAHAVETLRAQGFLPQPSEQCFR
ncbi:MAG: gluconokinase [Granulosicoccus sp.]|nr:gluconokinase [Granulosicoccus sp.]